MFVLQIKLKDDVTGQEFHFTHNDWVRAEEEGVPAQIELPAIRPDLAPLEGIKVEGHSRQKVFH